MRIIDLNEIHLPLYLVCLEDWSDEIKEAGDHKKIWYERMKEKGLRVKLVIDDSGNVGGMIQYLPVEHSSVEGRNLYFINCIWVHGHKDGRGNFQGRGMGKALLYAAEADAIALGAKGMVAWGLRLPFWMRASWFKKHGYRTADTMGIQALVWKPFCPDAKPPTWIRKRKNPSLRPDRVTVTALCNGWCPGLNLAFERAKRAAKEDEFKDKVVFQAINTFDRDAMLEWGLSDALFINRKQVSTGPPPSYERIKKIIARQVKRLRTTV